MGEPVHVEQRPAVGMSTSSDLRDFLRNVGGVRHRGGLQGAPEARKDADFAVELLDEGPSDIMSAPMPTAGFIDGIQNASVVTYRDHRPIYLAYVAAAVVGAASNPLLVDEQLMVVCSAVDEDWVRERAGTLTVKRVAGVAPDAVATDAYELIGSTRDLAEKAVLSEFLASTSDDAVIVDGALTGRPYDPRVVGVVKSTATKYLPDEAQLWSLRERQRSARFKIPAGNGHHRDRFSAYVRIVDASHQRWNHGMVRVETFNADLIDAAAARCVVERQHPGAIDSRWDRHLGGVRMVETFLRSRRPPVFS